MTGEPAHNPEVPARVELMRRIKELLRQAPTAPVPFFGDAQEFRDFAGDRLVIEIDPGQVADQFPVQKVINGKPIGFANHLMGRAGWKPHLERLERSTVYREIADLLAHDHDYRATPIYAELKTRVENGKPPVRNLVPLDSIAKLDLYFDKVVELTRSIASSGYKRRPRYKGMESAEEASRFSSGIRPVAVELTESEIGVAVGADGSLHRIGPGTHRLATARLLNLPRVPVEVRLFHVQWLRRVIAGQKRPMQAIFSAIADLGLPSVHRV